MRDRQKIVRELFLPQEGQPPELLEAVEVLTARDPHYDDFFKAIQVAEKYARARLPGASARDVDTAIVRLAVAMGFDRLRVVARLVQFRKKARILKKRKGEGGQRVRPPIMGDKWML